MICTWWWKCFMLIGAVETVAACKKTFSSPSEDCTYSDSMKAFNCTGVRLKTLKTGHLHTRPREIKRLLLVNTQLATLEPGVFSSVPNLLYLDLSNNFLEVLEFQIFSSLTQLQVLDLTNNKLKSLHDELLFKSQESLSSLLLANNQLTTLDFNVLIPLKSISTLVLTGNPFVCNCQLRLTMEWCREKRLHTNATCDLPRKYSGYQWSVLNMSEICKVTQMENTVNLNEYASTTEPSAGKPKTAERNGGTSATMIIIYLCLAIVVLCAAVVASLYCRVNCRREGTCKIAKPNNNLIDNTCTDYYTDVNPRPQNMDHLSLPPVLPKRQSPNGTSSKGQLQEINDTELYNYPEFNFAQPNNLTSSGQSSGNSQVPFKSNNLHKTEEIDSQSLYSNNLYVQT